MADNNKERRAKKARSAAAEVKLAREALAKAKSRYLTTEESYKLAAERLSTALKAVETEL